MAQVNLLISIILLSLILVNLVFLLIVMREIKKIRLEGRLSRKGRRLGSKIDKKLESEFAKQVNSLVVKYGQTLDTQLKQNLSQLAGQSSRIMVDLADFLKQQQSVIISQTEFLVARDLATTQKEIEAYRSKKIDQVSSQINSIILEVSRDVLGKSIDVATHQDLVMQALEKAKNENLFANVK